MFLQKFVNNASALAAHPDMPVGVSCCILIHLPSSPTNTTTTTIPIRIFVIRMAGPTVLPLPKPRDCCTGAHTSYKIFLNLPTSEGMSPGGANRRPPSQRISHSDVEGSTSHRCENSQTSRRRRTIHSVPCFLGQKGTGRLWGRYSALSCWGKKGLPPPNEIRKSKTLNSRGTRTHGSTRAH